jgi:hypothetical protein
MSENGKVFAQEQERKNPKHNRKNKLERNDSSSATPIEAGVSAQAFSTNVPRCSSNFSVVAFNVYPLARAARVCKTLWGICYNVFFPFPHPRQGSPMNTIFPRSETEALLHEKFQALLADLDTASDNAQYGSVLDALDDYLFLHGRKFLTEILQSKLQERINRAEKQSESKLCPHCKKKRKSTTKRKKH